MTELLNIHIDNIPVQVPASTTILHAARLAGRPIPTLCHADSLTPSGHCRLCLVESNHGLTPACHTPVTAAGVYHTNTPALLHYRQRTLALLLQHHPLHCPTCTNHGHCPLEQLIADIGLPKDFTPITSPAPVDTSHPLLHREPDKCILCGRCVRVCQEVQGCGVLAMTGRGDTSQISPTTGAAMLAAGCVSCGQCQATCPTAALRQAVALPAPPPERIVTTTCGYCAVGCRLRFAVANNRILWSEPDPDGPANRGHACVKGRFGHAFVHSPERLTQPLARQEDGSYLPISWEAALDLVAARLQPHRHQPDAFGLVASARCTNEENYLFQKFTRVVMGSNAVDNCARVCHAPSAHALGAALGTPAATNAFDDLEHTNLILLVGANPTSSHPVLGARIKQAVLRGATLIVIDPRRTELARLARLHLPLRPGSNLAVINAMQQVILAEGLERNDFIAAHAEGLEALRAGVAPCTPEWAEPLCGVPAASIREAARLYAASPAAMIFWGLGITESCGGSVAAFGLINLAILTNNLGRAGVGTNPIRGQNNVQGACDMGALPNVLSDYRPVSDPQARADHAAVWGIPPPDKPGPRIPEMLEMARAGRLKAMVVIGQDLALSDPHTSAVEAALARLDFLVVLEIFPSATARFAHVVLPAACFLEKEGSFVNSDRRFQLVQPVVAPPGEARPDGAIILELARRMGVELGSGGVAGIFDEMAGLSPHFRGVSWARLQRQGWVRWPCPAPDHPGTAIVHEGGNFLRGRARLTPTPWRPPLEGVDAEFPLLLVTGRTLYHYNVGSMTRRTPIVALNLREARGETVRMRPEDAQGLVDGALVRVESAYGAVDAVLELSHDTQPGVVFMAFHFPETRTNLLIGDQSDEYTRCPEYKATPVRVHALGVGRGGWEQ